MSDDLISRKAVLDYLKEQNNNLLKEKQKNGFVVSTEACRGMESALIAFRSFILSQPTAFDKEKVAEELRGQIELISYNPMTVEDILKKIERSRLSRKAELNNVIHRLSLLQLHRAYDRSQKSSLPSGLREVRGLESETAEGKGEEKEG